MMQKFHRGEIYYVSATKVVGHEMAGDRPAIIVSNDTCNEHSPVAEVVYLTTAYKRFPLPTHVRIHSSPRESTALCEQVDSIAIERFDKLIGRVTDEEMRRIDAALLVSLGIPQPNLQISTPEQRKIIDEKERTREQVERDLSRKMYEDLYRLVREMGVRIVAEE